MSNVDAAKRSLEKHVPHLRVFHSDILRGLHADHIIDGGDIDLNGGVHAVSSQPSFAQRLEAAAGRFGDREMRQAVAECKRLGITPTDDGVVSIHELNQVMAAKKLSPEKRIEIKTCLSRCGMID